ncbi:MAG TPA: hypothetical protein VEA92_01185 [Candidatus Paceibacterota bacterium]|nr:hypothetical protein [Candidatus Paceibacterota bacterium]
MEDELPEAPIEAIGSPLSFLPRVDNAYDLVSILFTGIFLLWAIYTVISIYHWLRYGHNSWIAVPSIALHLFISAVLMIFATSGFN